VNPAEVRQGTDLGSVMAELKVDFERKGTDLWFRCRSGEHPDGTPSCAMREEPGAEAHGLVFCHSCKWSTDVFGLVMAVKSCPFPEALHFVGRHREANLVEGEEDPAVYRRLLKRAGPGEVELPEGLRSIVFERGRRTECAEYLLSRGFGQREVDHFGLRDWPGRTRLFVPIFRNGMLISYVARTYFGITPKVLTPLAASGARWAMVNHDGLDLRKEEVHITEGWASCFRVWQAGFKNVVATCGSRLKLEQVLDLAWAKQFVLWQEGDRAGEAFFGELLAWLGRGRSVEAVVLPYKTDPADFGTRELLELYEHRII